ncbi:head-tail connector protein [Candidatus Pacearchaeota archaeon]|nr:head-tail connector protein [Candidatus Pacearchaeota archaeon]
MDQKKAEILLSEYSILKAKRDDLCLNQHMDIRDYILPMTGQFKGSDKDGDNPRDWSNILDNTAGRSGRVLVAGMQGGLTSPSRPWFKISHQDTDLIKNSEVKAFLHETEKRMYAVFAASNFYSAVNMVYREEMGYGAAVMLMFEDAKSVIRFYTLTAGEYCISQDDRRDVDGVYRTVYLNTAQLVKKFGKGALPQNIKDQLDVSGRGNPFKVHPVTHIIRGRDFYNPKMIDRLSMPFSSTYILEEEIKTVHESGFREWPCAVPRWTLTGSDPYGNGPCAEIIGDTKSLQEMVYDKLMALSLMIKPPMKAPSSLKGEVGGLEPGSVVYGDRGDIEKFETILEIAPNLAQFNQDIGDTRQQIRQGMYNDLFLSLLEEKGQMTATEVAERHEEKLLLLGDVIERQFTDLLNPTIERTFAIMLRQGMIPTVPQILIDSAPPGSDSIGLKVEFVSLLAQAQKLVTTQSIRAVTGFAMELMAGKPEVLDNVNFDAAINEYSDSVSAPPNLMNSEDNVIKIRQTRAQQQAAIAKQEQEALATDNAQKLGNTSTEDGTALAELKKTLEG